jgi:outer membrane murein-binding lipoprotein Lpp
MAIGSRMSRERRRRRGQFALRVTKWLLGLGIFAGLGVVAYQSGLELAGTEVTRLERRLDEVATEARDLQLRNSRLEADLRQAREANAALQRRYDRDVPSGASAAVFSLAQSRIGAGVPRERIEQVLRDAGPVRTCEARGTSRRFAIVYGARIPDNAGIELAEGLVRVVVSTAAQTDDIARTAQVVVTVAGQDPQTFTGLPQRQVVTLGNAELALNVTSEIRGFATAAITNCGG